ASTTSRSRIASGGSSGGHPARARPTTRASPTSGGSRRSGVGATANLRPRPRVQHVTLGLALHVDRPLVVVSEGCRFERPVARVRQHDPFAAPALAIRLEYLEPIGLAAAVLVDEVAEIVAEIEEDAIVLGNVGTARALGRAPIGLLARH